jgi:hypothetical protein
LESNKTSKEADSKRPVTPASLPATNVTNHEIIHRIVLYLAKKNPPTATYDKLQRMLTIECPGISKESIFRTVQAHRNLFTVIDNEVVILCELNQAFVGHYFSLDVGMNVVYTIENSQLSLMEPCSIELSETILVKGIACVAGQKEVGKKKREVFFYFGNFKSFMIKTKLCTDYHQGQILSSVLSLRKVLSTKTVNK